MISYNQSQSFTLFGKKFSRKEVTNNEKNIPTKKKKKKKNSWI